MVAAICKELDYRHGLIEDKELTSIYLGGGTPSLLNQEELSQIFNSISQYFSFSDNIEITLEGNPDDLSEAYLKWLAATPVNRLSIGVQSFFDVDLRFYNRAHNATESKSSIHRALDAGFDNLTIDLIYGTPSGNLARTQKNLEIVSELDPPHLSCYALTVEDKTALKAFIQKGDVEDVNPNKASNEFQLIMEYLSGNGYEHYEISNFAQPGYIAVHNTNYWKGEAYLGLGPSAHSYDGKKSHVECGKQSKIYESYTRR